MASDAEGLKKLQKLDIEIGAVHEAIGQISEAEERDEALLEVSRLKKALAVAEAKQKTETAEVRRVDDQLQSVLTRIGRDEERLFGGAVGDPRELAGIQDNLRSMGRTRDELETAYLIHLEQSELAVAAVDEIKVALEAAVGNVRRLQEEYERKVAEFRDDLQTAEAARGEAVVAVSGSALGLYEEARRSGKGVALTKIVANTCEACHLELPAEELDKISSAEGFSHCPFCHRLILADGDPDSTGDEV
ncbi:MAG: zinc ribbon domain-containing protein [Terriglobia bacterium]